MVDRSLELGREHNNQLPLVGHNDIPDFGCRVEQFVKSFLLR